MERILKLSSLLKGKARGVLIFLTAGAILFSADFAAAAGLCTVDEMDLGKCVCIVKKNESRGDYYYQVFKNGSKTFTSSTSTNTKDKQSQRLICESKISGQKRCAVRENKSRGDFYFEIYKDGAKTFTSSTSTNTKDKRSQRAICRSKVTGKPKCAIKKNESRGDFYFVIYKDGTKSFTSSTSTNTKDRQSQRAICRSKVTGKRKCAIKKNESRGDFYFEIYKDGAKTFTSSTSTNTKDKQSQRAICRSKVTGKKECAVRKNESRGDFYFQIYENGVKIFTSSTSTNTQDEESQMSICLSKIAGS